MKKLKCVAIEDEPLALDIICDYIKKTSNIELMSSFRDPLGALAYVQSNDIDLIFLDINMPDLNGMQFLKSLTKLPMIIFTTAYSEYAVESYEYQAIDYLLKPIEFDRFLKAVNKAYDQFLLKNPEKEADTIHINNLVTRDNKNYLLVKTGTETKRIMLNDILFIEGSGNYVVFVTVNGKIMSLMKLKELTEILQEPGFLRIHKSYIVALSKIDTIESFQVRIGEKTIPIGNIYRDKFLKLINR